jgi:hypothetical protein
MQLLEGSGTLVLYTGRTVLKGQYSWLSCGLDETSATSVV